MAVQQECAVGIVNCIKTLWGEVEDNFLDFEVKVGDETFKCHRFILAACSPYFKELFRSGLEETINGSSTLKDMSSATFKLILTAIYTGSDVLTGENVIDVWKAAHLLQIDFMIKHCEKCIVQGLTLDNFKVIYKLAKELESKVVANAAVELIFGHFDTFKDSEFLHKLTCDEILIGVRSHNLVTSNEENVVKAILKWVNKNKNDANKLQMLAPLLKAARLSNVSPSFLNEILKNNLVKADPEAKDALIEALLYQNYLNSVGQWLQWPLTAVYRAHSGNDNFGVIVKTNGHVETFSMTRNKWFNLPRIPLPPVECPENNKISIKIQVFKKEIYILFSFISIQKNGNLPLFGNTSWLSRFRQNKWKTLTRITTSEPLCLLGNRDCLYIPCLMDTTIYIFNPSKETAELETIRIPFSHTGPRAAHRIQYTYAIHYDETNILAFYDDPKLSVTGVDGLNLNDKNWTQLTEIIKSANGLTHFIYDNDTFILQSNGALHKLIINTDGAFCIKFEFIEKLWKFDSPLHGAFMYCNNLVVFGKHPSENVDRLTMDSKGFGVITYWIINDEVSNVVPMVLSKNEVSPICTCVI